MRISGREKIHIQQIEYEELEYSLKRLWQSTTDQELEKKTLQQLRVSNVSEQNSVTGMRAMEAP